MNCISIIINLLLTFSNIIIYFYSNQILNGTGTLAFSNHKDLSSTCSTTNLDVTDGINLGPSELEAASN